PAPRPRGRAGGAAGAGDTGGLLPGDEPAARIPGRAGDPPAHPVPGRPVRTEDGAATRGAAGGARQRGPLAGPDRAARAGARVLEEVGVFMDHPNVPVALLLLVMTGLILGFIATARRRTLFIRRIPGLSAVEEAVGRAV